MIVALVKLHNPDFDATNGKMLYVFTNDCVAERSMLTFHSGITLSLTFFCFLCSVLPTRWIARVNSAMTWFQTAGLIVVIIGLPAAVVNRPSTFLHYETRMSSFTEI